MGGGGGKRRSAGGLNVEAAGAWAPLLLTEVNHQQEHARSRSHKHERMGDSDGPERSLGALRHQGLSPTAGFAFVIAGRG